MKNQFDILTLQVFDNPQGKEWVEMTKEMIFNLTSSSQNDLLRQEGQRDVLRSILSILNKKESEDKNARSN